jgi:hypothetical protein
MVRPRDWTNEARSPMMIPTGIDKGEEESMNGMREVVRLVAALVS